MKLGPRWRLEVFGSIANGFSTNGSDMDATCVQAPAEEEEDEKEETPSAAAILQERLSPLLRQQEQFQVIEEIPSAKVPILRLRFEGRVEVDLSCQNTAALLNTRLLRAYADLDPRVRDLGIAVKLWAKAAGVCGAAFGNLSSYAFTLMVIYFMQVHTDVNLPCISTSIFEELEHWSPDKLPEDPAAEAAMEKLERIQQSWSCDLELSDLLFRFFGFYTMFFDWGREVISIRIGQRCYSRESVFQELRGRFVPRIHVEDPYKLERNLHCVLGEAEEGQLREAFRTGWHILINGRTLAGLRPAHMEGRKTELQLSEQIHADMPVQSDESSQMIAAFLKPESEEVTAEPLTLSEASETGTNPEDELLRLKAECADPAFEAIPVQSPGAYSSSGSTAESGDDKCVTLDPCTSSSGESRLSDDECAAVKRQSSDSDIPLAVTKVPIERSMPPLDFHEEPHQADSALNADGPKQWWQNLGSADVMKAVHANHAPEEEARKGSKARPHFVSLEAIESQMVQKQEEDKEVDTEVELSPTRLMHLGIADKVKRSLAAANASKPLALRKQPPPSPAPATAATAFPAPPPTLLETGGMWWQNLGSADVKQAVQKQGIEAVAPQEEAGSKWRRSRNRKKPGLTVQDVEGKMVQEPRQSENAASGESNHQILSLLGGSFAAASSSKIASRIALNYYGQASALGFVQ
jgi:hypothetical protein